MIVFCLGLAFVVQGAALPLMLIQGGRAGFMDAAGRVLALPRYARAGAWSEDRLWVQEQVVPGAPGTFLDASAKPVAPSRYCDLFAVRPELPMPTFERAVAVVGLRDGGFGYVDLGGKLFARTTSAGAFQRQGGDWLLAAEDGRVGFVSRDGAKRIPARFEDARPFRGSRAAARIGERWGLIDESGRWVVEPSFTLIFPVQNSTSLWACREGGCWGLLNDEGRRLTDSTYDEIGLSRDGAVAVKTAAGWGLLDAEGVQILVPRYEMLAPLGDAAGFWAALGRNGKWGVVASNGVEIAVCGLDLVDAPAPGILLAAKAGSWGVLDPREGTWRLPSVFERVLPLSSPFAGLALVEQRGRWGVADVATGRLVLKAELAGIRPWGDWLAVEKGTSVQLHDRNGKRVREWKGRLDGLPPFEALQDGLGVLRLDGGATLVTSRGELPWPTPFDDAGDWSGGALAVKRDGRWGYVRQDGGWRIRPTFAAAGPFAEGVAPAGEGGRWGLIDAAGAWRIKPTFEGMGTPWRGRVPVLSGGKWGLVDFDGGTVLDCVCDGLEWGIGDAGETRFYGATPERIPGLDGYVR
ncbi:MAG: WG repeat-containing protein [Kiritimatiellia bacterium]